MMPSQPGQTEIALAKSESRNEASTPRSAILPSSPALAKKLKTLPGNSKTFSKIVSRTQISLASSGYDVGPINGQIHARTVAAIYEFQERSGMIPTGKLTNDVLGSLGIIAE